MERQSKWASARGSPVCQHMPLPPTRKVSSDITSSQCHLGLTMSQVQQILFPSCYLNNKKKNDSYYPWCQTRSQPSPLTQPPPCTYPQTDGTGTLLAKPIIYPIMTYHLRA